MADTLGMTSVISFLLSAAFGGAALMIWRKTESAKEASTETQAPTGKSGRLTSSGTEFFLLEEICFIHTDEKIS